MESEKMPEVINFLLGQGTLDGIYYGERPGGKPMFWWRKALKEAWNARDLCATAGDAKEALELQHFENGKHADIVERLRGKVMVPINDGLGPVEEGGRDDFFERSFPTSIAAKEAADYIERLRAALSGENK